MRHRLLLAATIVGLAAGAPAEREARKDPRPSVGERYGGLTGYMQAVDREIERQVAAGFLLPQERDRARTMMRINWDRIIGLRPHWPRPKP